MFAQAKASTPTHHNSHKNPSAMLVTTKKLAVDGAAATSSASFDETHKKREQSVATPTDFAQDYGKPPASTGSFDTSNVLAWLQSPTANGLFSPGGYANIMGTPGGPKTPRTPTVSTSFFFSDVASLAKGEDSETPKNGKKKGIANIICISPLASSKARNGATPPVNMKEIFMSPEERRSRLRGMPLLSEDGNSKGRPRVPLRSASKDPSVEAVHLAERDLMEDEDMSVLLQLASNTPRSSAGGPVFRSPIPPPKGEMKKGENMPALQLPMIGGKDVSNVRLEQKSGDDAFIPPHLRMRDGTDAKKDRKEDKDGETSGKPHGRYPMHPHYPPHPDAPYGYPIPGVPMHHHGGPGGTMRVSIGGPPPPNKGTPPRPGMNSPRPPPPHYHEYPYPPPPHGMYPPQYPGPHPPMGYPPYPGHYPHGRHPPPPMPGYAAHPGAKKAGKGKKGAKRGLADAEEKGSKKRRSPGSSRKRRQVTPEVEGAARQKAAAVLGVNGSSGGKNDKAAALAAAILRGVTMRPSGKWVSYLVELKFRHLTTAFSKHNCTLPASQGILEFLIHARRLHWLTRLPERNSSRVRLMQAHRTRRIWSMRLEKRPLRE